MSAFKHRPCLCRRYCGDVAEADDPLGICRDLPPLPKPPLVEIVPARRRDVAATGEPEKP